MKSTIALFAIAGLAGAANANIIASTSFENAASGFGKYFSAPGEAAFDHALDDHVGEPVVNYTADGTEMGFRSYYRNTRNGTGLEDGDFIGVTSYTGTVGSFSDGSQGFQFQDADGALDVRLDTVNYVGAWQVSVDFWIQDTGYESDDMIRIFLTVDGGVEIDLLNVSGTDASALGSLNAWTTLTFDLSAYTTAELTLTLDSNSASEAVFMDNVVFSQIPTPGTAALLGLGGLVATRRRRA